MFIWDISFESPLWLGTYAQHDWGVHLRCVPDRFRSSSSDSIYHQLTGQGPLGQFVLWLTLFESSFWHNWWLKAFDAFQGASNHVNGCNRRGLGYYLHMYFSTGSVGSWILRFKRRKCVRSPGYRINWYLKWCCKSYVVTMQSVMALLNCDCVWLCYLCSWWEQVKCFERRPIQKCDRRWNSQHVQSEILWLLPSNSYRPPAPADGVVGLWMS